MNIIRQEYDEFNRLLQVEFSNEEDGDTFYRVIELTYKDVIYYSPNIIDESDLSNLEDSDVLDILQEYFKENDLPTQLYL